MQITLTHIELFSFWTLGDNWSLPSNKDSGILALSITLLDALQEYDESLSELHPWMENNVIGKELWSTHDLAINSEKQEVNSCIMIFIISNCSPYYFLSACLSYKITKLQNYLPMFKKENILLFSVSLLQSRYLVNATPKSSTTFNSLLKVVEFWKFVHVGKLVSLNNVLESSRNVYQKEK